MLLVVGIILRLLCVLDNRDILSLPADAYDILLVAFQLVISFSTFLLILATLP